MKPLDQYTPRCAPIVPWASAEQGEWEMNVLLALGLRLGTDSSDTIDLIAPWDELMADAWAERLDPEATAALIDQVGRIAA